MQGDYLMRHLQSMTPGEIEFFTERIKKLNAAHDQGSTHLIKMDGDKAMLIYWGDHGWDCTVYELES